MSTWPTREITDPTMLRAMAHPLRLKLMNDLVIHGPSTATELAERNDESAANCSWHLRQLAKFGLIEEAADLPTKGRNRPWRWVPIGNRWGEGETSPELARAAGELMTQLMGHEFAQRQAWEERKANEPAEWTEAAFAMQSLVWLTSAELAEIKGKITEMVLSHHNRAGDATTRPEGAQPIRFVAWGNPAS